MVVVDVGQVDDVTTALLSSTNGSMDINNALYTAAAEEDPPPPAAAATARRRYRHNRHVRILVAAAVLVGLASGTLYGFGRYSRALKERLGIDQLRIQRFGILLDTGNYIGHPLTGYVYDHYGPRASCVGAAIVVFCGYGAIATALFFQDSNHNNVVGLCDVGFFGVGFGSGLGYVAGLGTITKTFLGKPTLSRAVAAVAAGYGLSSTLVGIAFRRIPSLHGFFLFWAIAVAVVNLIGAVVFANGEGEEQEIHSMMDNIDAVDDTSNSMNRDNEDGNGHSSSMSMDDEIFREQQFIQHQLPNNTNWSRPGDAISTRSLQSSYRPWAFGTRLRSWTTWQRSDFWILFGSFACVTGCGLFVINNISTMVQSIGETDSVAGNLVFLLSICNVSGRILMGALADLPRVNKIVLFQGVAILMVLGLLVSATSPFGEGDRRQLICLIFTVTAVASAYGGSWVLIVGILADLYGKEDFGKDYGLIVMGPAISGLIFNSASALIYERRAEANGDENGVCLGDECYRGSYWMTASVAFVGCLILYQMPRTEISPTAR